MVRISVELSDEVAEALGRAAATLSSTPEFLLAEAAHDIAATLRDQAGSADDGFAALVANPAAFAAYLAPALADGAAGRVVDHKVVFAELDAIVADALARKPG